jgi:predicted alpha/beta-hydrolase family hydrolase
MDAEITRLQFEAYKGGPKVSAIFQLPRDAKANLVFAHGSHSPMQHSLMVDMAHALANNRVATFRFNYPYSESYQPSGWEVALDSIEVLLDTAESAVNKAISLAHDMPLFVGGRSMSSQITTLLASQGRTLNAKGIVAFVFPMKWRDLLPDPTSHFSDIDEPMLCVQGDQDDLTDNDELQQVLSQIKTATTLHVIKGANHRYEVPTGLNKTTEDVVHEAASTVSDWIDEII